MPGLEVRCFVKGTEEVVHCELDYQSGGTSVLVIAGLESVTVAVDGEKEGLASAGGGFVVGFEKSSGGR